ncbi:hypothetical protein MSAS_04180 [Mycobacterium saskatchewanense]|nr:hypothetical protein MSAS_04180 [Mycobacterium saskatchewanense]
MIWFYLDLATHSYLIARGDQLPTAIRHHSNVGLPAHVRPDARSASTPAAGVETKGWAPIRTRSGAAMLDG